MTRPSNAETEKTLKALKGNLGILDLMILD